MVKVHSNIVSGSYAIYIQSSVHDGRDDSSYQNGKWFAMDIMGRCLDMGCCWQGEGNPLCKLHDGVAGCQNVRRVD